MKTGAAYIRVSTDEQTEYSPDSQLRIIMDYAHREGITIPKEYIFSDEGISGRSASKRPGFMRMISLAKSHAFDVILVYSLSRFARSREDSIVYKKMLRHECGVDVISVSQNIGSDKTSILMEAILEAMDEYYSIDLSENVRRGMLEKASRGEAMGRAPFGYKICGRIFVPDENTAPIVRMIFSDYISGMGVRTIAEKLNLMGIRTSSGRQFENRTVSYILKNEV